jgi:hypothetical protein
MFYWLRLSTIINAYRNIHDEHPSSSALLALAARAWGEVASRKEAHLISRTIWQIGKPNCSWRKVKLGIQIFSKLTQSSSDPRLSTTDKFLIQPRDCIQKSIFSTKLYWNTQGYLEMRTETSAVDKPNYFSFLISGLQLFFTLEQRIRGSRNTAFLMTDSPMPICLRNYSTAPGLLKDFR